MKTLVIHHEQWDSAPRHCVVTEAELLMLINVCLEETMYSCVVKSLRYVDGQRRNWEVASLELHDVRDEDANDLLTYLGHLIAQMTDGYYVAWPSTLLH